MGSVRGKEIGNIGKIKFERMEVMNKNTWKEDEEKKK